MVEKAKEIVLEPTVTGLRIILKKDEPRNIKISNIKGTLFSALFLDLIVKVGDVIESHTETEIEDITNKDYESKDVDDILNSPKVPYQHDFENVTALMREGLLSRDMGGGVLHKVGKIPFKVVKTEPKGEVKIVNTTNVSFVENISANAIFVKNKPNLKNLHEVKDCGEWIKVCGKFVVGAYQEKDGKTLYFSNMFYYIE